MGWWPSLRATVADSPNTNRPLARRATSSKLTAEMVAIDQPFFTFFAFAIGADEESAAKIYYKSQTFGSRKAKTQPRTEGRQSRCPAFGVGGRWRRKNRAAANSGQNRGSHVKFAAGRSLHRTDGNAPVRSETSAATRVRVLCWAQLSRPVTFPLRHRSAPVSRRRAAAANGPCPVRKPSPHR